MIKIAARGGALSWLAALGLPTMSFAQAETPLPGVVVTAPAPFPGSALDSQTAPTAITVLNGADLARGGAPDALRALDEQAPGVQLDSTSGNPYQPSLYYRGFQAAPLQGTSQGLAVYLGGVRLNQAFGDTVNWDLIPSLAVDRITLAGSNPVFGLNALGGALDVQLKSGFSLQGGEADLSGGSFGQVRGDLQYGLRRGDLAFYLAASSLHEDGWRDLQSSDIQSLYGDLGWRNARAEAHLSLRLAQSNLNGPGSSPVELLAADPRAQLTAPNAIKNGYAAVSLAGRYDLSAQTTLQAIFYGEDFRQNVVNGNAPNDTPCDDGSGLLCSDAGPSTTRGGAAIPAFLGPDPLAYSELDTQTTATVGYGATVQLIDARKIMGLANRLVLGASFDGADTGFSGQAFIGGLTPVSRVFVGPGVLIDESGQNSPVRLAVRDAYVGVFAGDTLEVTSRLSITLSGRYNAAEIDLEDQGGGDLTGRHHYDRFNPAIGGAYQAADWLTFYGGYAEANRAPTPAELSCASPADACSLANFFVGDPELKQVIARTVEAGFRGRFALRPGVTLDYGGALYRSDLTDDIAFVNSPVLNRAFFANIGRTRRQGLDANLALETPRWRFWAAYSHTEATYRTGFVEDGGQNPAADVNGQLTIRPGDRFAGVPANSFKLGASFKATPALTLGLTAEGRDRAFLFGDEANLTPELPGYVVVNLNGVYQLTPRLRLFARIENVGDARYYTYGTFSPTTSVRLIQAPSATNPRSYSPAAPIGGFGGIKVSF